MTSNPIAKLLTFSFLACAAVALAADATTASTASTVSSLSFAVTGNTRPATVDDVANYPTAVIEKIYADIQAVTPAVPFVVATGNYMYATYSNLNGTQSAQINDYLSARNAYTGTVLPAMGNQECAELETGNCGTNLKLLNYPKAGGTTENYAVFLNSMLMPIKQSLPYYTIKVNGPTGTWTSKFVFVACNAWSSTQANWLNNQLSAKTTYTFIVRNAPMGETTEPCVGSADGIMHKHPYTLLIAGHQGTSTYVASEKELIVGNGGGPLLPGSTSYGYVIARQQSNGDIQFTAYDYLSGLLQYGFTVDANGVQH
jgi:hypothetical protein